MKRIFCFPILSLVFSVILFACGPVVSINQKTVKIKPQAEIVAPMVGVYQGVMHVVFPKHSVSDDSQVSLEVRPDGTVIFTRAWINLGQLHIPSFKCERTGTFSPGQLSFTTVYITLHFKKVPGGMIMGKTLYRGVMFGETFLKKTSA